MSNVWREQADPKKHIDFMGNQHVGGLPIEPARDNLLKKWVYFARVKGFTFQFIGLDQVKECRDYFEKKIHPSTIDYHPPYEHYWQQWYTRLPKGIRSEKNRVNIVKALNKIIEQWGKNGS